MPREPLPEEQRRVRVTFTVAPDVCEILRRLAKQRKTSRSALVEELIRVASTKEK